jgi:Ni/Co efflux regulator RcnB
MKRLLTGALALSLLTGTAAMAQPDHRDRGDQRNDQGGYNQDRDHGYNNGGDRRDHGYDRGGDRHDNGHHWGRGQRMPREYYQDRSRYVDYRAYHLRAPPRGYRWVRTDDNNYAMVAITTGLIAAIIAGNR